MNRRSFLQAILAAPVAAVAAPVVLARHEHPLALIHGEPINWAVVGEVGPEIVDLPVASGKITDTDAAIRKSFQEGVQEALAQYSSRLG